MPDGWWPDVRPLRFALLALSRDWRSGELAVLLAALLVAVTALTGVGFFTSRIGEAVERQASEVIAADLRLQAGHALSDTYVEAAARASDFFFFFFFFRKKI